MTSRIAVVLPPREGFEPHAAGAVALCVADFARHTRDDTTIYGTKGEGFPGLRYHRLDAKRPFHRSHGAHYLRQLARALEAERPALVEIHNRPALALALARCWPVALHLHNDPQAMRGAATLAERRRLLARLRGVHAVSGFVAGRFLDGLPDPAGKVAVTPNGLALPDTLPEKQPIILYAGRLAETKGAHEFAEALEIALPQLPGWRGRVVGADRHAPGGRATPYEQGVAAILHRLEAAGLAEWHGYLPHAETLAAFAEAAIAVVPSVWDEPFGRTALEAMAHGCALVTSGRGGLAEVVGQAARIVPPEPPALAEAIVALARDREARGRLGEAARRQAACFDIAAMTKRLDDARHACMNRA